MLSSPSRSVSNNFISSGAILLLGLAMVAVPFYLALAARLADDTMAFAGAVRSTAPSILIGEDTRPTQTPIR